MVLSCRRIIKYITVNMWWDIMDNEMDLCFGLPYVINSADIVFLGPSYI